MREVVKGTLKTHRDKDYFVFKKDNISKLNINVTNIDTKRTVFAYLYDKNQDYVALSSKNGSKNFEKEVEAGTYYLMLYDGYDTG
ncbi:MAG: hypothetical protein M3512_09745, partial [Bacteroidota bacterium]|nr:hypothetical protein [Bacteroidota bacterium]